MADKGFLNRSRQERLQKASKLGIGPWAQKAGPPPAKRPADRSATNEEADLNSFLTKRGKDGASSSTLELRLSLSSETSQRAIAAQGGAKPKAGVISGAAAEERRRRQEEEKAYEEFLRVQEATKQAIGLDTASPDGHAVPDQDTQERRHREKEERRKREEWRKKWREEQRKRDEEREAEERQRRRKDEEEEKEIAEREELESRRRANMWGALNNEGLNHHRDIDFKGKPLGQLSDADIDKRFKTLHTAPRHKQDAY